MQRSRIFRCFLWGYFIFAVTVVFSTILRLGVAPSGPFLFALLFFLLTGCATIFLLFRGGLRGTFKKEKEEIGNPKHLLRNYALSGLLVFSILALMSFFGLLHDAQRNLNVLGGQWILKGAGYRIKHVSNSPLTVVHLMNILPTDERYLTACSNIIKDLKAAKARVVMLLLPADFSLTELNYDLLNELNESGIVVFGIQKKVQDEYNPDFHFFPIDVDNTTATDEYYLVRAVRDRLRWGLVTAESSPYRYYPQYGWRLSDTLRYPAEDICLEILRMYVGYPADTESKRIKNDVVMGNYRIPVFREGFTCTAVDFWLDDRNEVNAEYDKVSNKIEYSETKSEFYDLCKEKIVIISPRSSFRVGGPFGFMVQAYADIIQGILTDNLLLPLDDWNEIFIVLSIVFTALVCHKLSALDSVAFLTSSSIAIFLGGLLLVNQFHVFIETIYMIMSIVFCTTAFHVAKLAQKRRTIEQRIVLELEKKAILESQKGQLEVQVAERTAELRAEKDKSDRLLYNILPKEIADELKESGVTPARRFEEVSIMFTDFRGFTSTVASIPASRLVDELNDIFHHVDDITERNGLEKIKTIGDAYMAVAGLPMESNIHALQAVKAALQILSYIDERNKSSFIKWEMRAGIHSGTVVAGVVGKWKFTYDIWGDAVNIANRLESAGVPGKVNISAFTYDLIKDQFDCEYRGKIDAKGKGEIDMYFVLEEKSLRNDA